MNALAHIQEQPWAIRRESMETIVSIASRMNETPQAVSARLGRPLDNTRTVELRDGVAIIPVSGPIFRYANLFTDISGATSIEILARDFTAALEDPSVRAIVLNVDSPGGEVKGVNAFAEMIYGARGVKPIVAYVGGSACSAAYWIAAATSEIVIDETAPAGSIGTIVSLCKGDPASPTIDFVSSQSPQKRADPETEAGRAAIQSHVDALAEVFIGKVALYRDTTPEKVISDFGGGWIEIGQKAVSVGLADRVGSLELVIAELTSGYRP